MTHASGIKPSQELLSAFLNPNNDLRCLQVSIENEQLVLSAKVQVVSNLINDMDSVSKLAPSNSPAFFLVRTDKSEWFTIQYVPESAHVRDKMVYASSKNSLIRELGENKFTEHIYATSKSDFSSQGYKNYLNSKNGDKPLSEREKELERIRFAERQEMGTGGRNPMLTKISLSLQESVEPAIDGLITGDISAVCLEIQNESIYASKTSSGDFLKEFNDSVPQFILCQRQSKLGMLYLTLVFVYVCPPKVAIKQKMVYSSSKAQMVAFIENKTAISNKYEVDNFDELEQEFTILDNQGSTKPNGFSRPTRPGLRK